MFESREKQSPNCNLGEEVAEDVVDATGGDAWCSRGGGAVGASDSEGPSERGDEQQGTVGSEPPCPPHDRYHLLHHRKTRKYYSSQSL